MGLVRRNECDIAEAPRDVPWGVEAKEKVRHLTDGQACLFFRATAGHR